jgi:predicted RNA binding protein with dsRBD fold (UPF0201 family)
MSKETVRISIYLSAEEYDALERLRQLLGYETIAETIRVALKTYGVTFGTDNVAKIDR